MNTVIIGAGASGLRLATLLMDAGVSVVVVEARDRIGGRLFSVDPGVDLGASWFWQNEGDVVQVIKECGLGSFDQFATGNMMFQTQVGVQELNGNPLDQKAFRIVGGTQQLAFGLVSKISEDAIWLNTTATSVQYVNNMVHVSTSRGDIHAQRVVIALPPALAMTSLSFSPVLPHTLVELAQRTPVWMGAMSKVVAIYDTAFWRKHGLSGSAMSHVGPLREIHDISDEHATFGALFGFSREPVTPAGATAQLTALFGAKAATPTSLIIEDWSRHPYTSPPGVFQLNDYQLFGSRVLREAYWDSRLFFTSTETAVDSPGHIQGALSAARRTASALLSVS